MVRGPTPAVPVFFTLFLSATPLLAQVDEKKFLEEERRRAMDERARTREEYHQPFLWDFGGWLHSAVTQLDDAPLKDTRTVRYADLRLWAEARIDRRYLAYLRLQAAHTDFNQGDQFAGEEDDRFRAHVDQAYVQGDFSSEEGDDGLVRLGRQFLTMGRGLLFNNVAYAAMGEVSSGRFTGRAFLAHTVVHDDDIDKSRPNFRDSRRGFAGLELEYLVTGPHRAYLLGLVEKDFEDDETATQSWEYQANYVGLGARGPVAGSFGYSVEGVYEFGASAASGTTDTEDIRAWALLARLDYSPGSELSPYLVAEYLFGSGDPDRGSVTDLAIGNAPGTEDEGFLAFGFVQTGFSLFPRVSNIHIFKFGGTLRPLESVELFKYFEVGAFAYFYRKAEKEQLISDPRAIQPDEDVGKEIDVLVRWRITSDVGFSFSFGRFFPGDAYLDDEERDFISAALTYSF